MSEPYTPFEGDVYAEVALDLGLDPRQLAGFDAEPTTEQRLEIIDRVLQGQMPVDVLGESHA